MEETCSYNRCSKLGVVICTCISTPHVYCYDHCDYHDPTVTLRKCTAPKLYIESYNLVISQLKENYRMVSADIKKMKTLRIAIVQDLTSKLQSVQQKLSETNAYYKNLVKNFSTLNYVLQNYRKLEQTYQSLIFNPPNQEQLRNSLEPPSISTNYNKNVWQQIISFNDPKQTTIADFIQNFQEQENNFNIQLDLNYLDKTNLLSPHYKLKLKNQQKFTLSNHTKQNFFKVLTAAFSQIMVSKDKLVMNNIRQDNQIEVKIDQNDLDSVKASRIQDLIQAALISENLNIQPLNKSEMAAKIAGILPPQGIDLQIIDHYGIGAQLIKKFATFCAAKLPTTRDYSSIIQNISEFLKQNRKHLNFIVQQTSYIPDKKTDNSTFIVVSLNDRPYLFKHQKIDSSPTSPCKYPGIANRGSTDYLNAVLQSLLHISPFISFLKLSLYPEHTRCVPELLNNVLQNLKSNKSSIANKNIGHLIQVLGPPWNSSTLQDPKEFFGYLIQQLKELHSFNAAKIFLGEKNVVKQFSCGKRSEGLQQFLYLPMSALKPQEAFNTFLQQKRNETSLYCSTCLITQPCVQTSVIQSMPKVLVGLMQDYNERILDKQTQSVIIVNSQTEYRLKSVICRTGGSSTYGHFSAICQIEGSWWKFDDQLVTSQNSSSIHTPYLLFYEFYINL